MTDDRAPHPNNPVLPGLTALLLARGCPVHALDAAYDWLRSQGIRSQPTAILTQVDEAISIATALTEQTG